VTVDTHRPAPPPAEDGIPSSADLRRAYDRQGDWAWESGEEVDRERERQDEEFCERRERGDEDWPPGGRG
jgi:hypothetical protein